MKAKSKKFPQVAAQGYEEKPFNLKQIIISKYLKRRGGKQTERERDAA
jgi:hypothetical protein